MNERRERDALLVRVVVLEKALDDAARSLETLSFAGARGYELDGDLINIRGYANSRARAAREQLTAKSSGIIRCNHCDQIMLASEALCFTCRSPR